MVYGTQITIVTGANLNQQTSLGGAHIVCHHCFALWTAHNSDKTSELKWQILE